MRLPFSWAYWQRRIAERRERRELQTLLESLEGRSVAIVDNAISLLSHQYGSLIDGHEVVVRMNRGFPVNPAAQGVRFDLWCFSGPRVALEKPKAFVAPRSVWMWHNRMKKEKVGPDFDCLLYPRPYWRALRDRLGARPSLGALTIDLIARAAPREVTVIGFDFKRTKSVYQRFNHIGPHDFAAEERYIMELVKERSWRFIAM